MQTARSLVEQMEKSENNSPIKTARTTRADSLYQNSIRKRRPSKIALQKQKAEIRYKKLTSLTKSEMMSYVRDDMNSRNIRNPEWKYEPYRMNNTFSVCEKYRGIEQFPHNNKKYNVQFLEKTLEGGKFNLTVRDNGFFPKTQDKLYSSHYKPIVTQKRKYNEDYQLRASMFGKIDLDNKRDRIMDKYLLQTNPFSTQRSNTLLSTMRPARKHRFS